MRCPKCEGYNVKARNALYVRQNRRERTRGTAVCMDCCAMFPFSRCVIVVDAFSADRDAECAGGARHAAE